MIENSIGYVLLLLGLSAIALQRLYSAVPMRELKRLAGRGDSLAARLYRVVAYGLSLRLLLWIIVAASIPAGLLLTVTAMPHVAGFGLLLVVALAGFVFLPSMPLTQRSAQFAALVVPPIAWLLSRTHMLLDRLARMTNHFRDLPLHHSRLYEKEDLLELVGRQRGQADNRIHADDLDLVQRALQFSDTRAGDIIQPRQEAHLVNADDSIGPILLDRLHKQKQQSFLVYKDTKETIIGSLAMSDAVKAKHGGRVFDLIRSDLIFIHEDFTARQVLNAFHKTGHQVAIVINNAEEFVGVITLNHLLKVLLGEAQDEELAYGDRAAVAAYKPKAKAEPQPMMAHEESDDVPDDLEAAEESETPATSPEATEVVK